MWTQFGCKMAIGQNLTAYVQKHGQLRAQLTRFQAFLYERGNAVNITQLRLRVEKIKELWGVFDEVQNSIEEKDDSQEQLL